MKKCNIKKLILVFSLVMTTAITGCNSSLYHDYEFNNSPVTLSTDDNRWFGLNQRIRIVTKGDDELLDYEIKENDDGSTTVILYIGEKKNSDEKDK